MQRLVTAVVAALTRSWGCPASDHRLHPIVAIADNSDQLRSPADGAARQARSRRYVTATRVLRTQTSAMLPPLVRRLATDPPADLLLVCPGRAYRHDAIDRLHCTEPHQLDLWRLTTRTPQGIGELRAMTERVTAAFLPGHQLRLQPTAHPYTVHGHQISTRTFTSTSPWFSVHVSRCSCVPQRSADDQSH